MIEQDALERDETYTRPKFREKPATVKRVQDDAPIKVDSRKVLLRIASDTAESHSIRQDAKRLLELADVRPRDFNFAVQDFLEWRQTFLKENQI